MPILTEGNNNNKEVSSNHLAAKVPLKADEERKGSLTQSTLVRLEYKQDIIHLKS